MPMALLPGLPEMELGPSIGSHQYLIFLSPPDFGLAPAFIGVSSMWQMGQLPGWSWITCGCMPHVHNCRPATCPAPPPTDPLLSAPVAASATSAAAANTMTKAATMRRNRGAGRTG